MHELPNALLIDSEKSPKINDVFKSNKVFTCDVCGKLLKSKLNLKYHVKTHRWNANVSVKKGNQHKKVVYNS